MINFIRKRSVAMFTAASMGLLAPTAALAFPECLAVPAAVAGVSGAVCTGALTAAIPACSTIVWFDFGTSCGIATMTAAASCGVSLSSVGAMIANCIF